jgi:hypothetical protein
MTITHVHGFNAVNLADGLIGMRRIPVIPEEDAVVFQFQKECNSGQYDLTITTRMVAIGHEIS